MMENLNNEGVINHALSLAPKSFALCKLCIKLEALVRLPAASPIRIFVVESLKRNIKPLYLHHIQLATLIIILKQTSILLLVLADGVIVY